MKRITDKDFVYTPSYATDLSRRVQEHLKAVRKMRRKNAKEAKEKVEQLPAAKVKRA